MSAQPVAEVPWVLIMIEEMMAEWGFSFEKAMLFPMAVALALRPARLARVGVNPGLCPADKARQKMRAKAWAFLRQHYDIAPSTRKPAHTLRSNAAPPPRIRRPRPVARTP